MLSLLYYPLSLVFFLHLLSVFKLPGRSSVTQPNSSIPYTFVPFTITLTRSSCPYFSASYLHRMFTVCDPGNLNSYEDLEFSAQQLPPNILLRDFNLHLLLSDEVMCHDAHFLIIFFLPWIVYTIHPTYPLQLPYFLPPIFIFPLRWCFFFLIIFPFFETIFIFFSSKYFIFYFFIFYFLISSVNHNFGLRNVERYFDSSVYFKIWYFPFCQLLI